MNKMPLILLIFWLGLSAANSSFAGCAVNLGDAPEIHFGAKMTEAEMLELQGEVKAYIKRGEEILSCKRSTVQYNALVYKIKKVADNYNQKLQAFNTTLAIL